MKAKKIILENIFENVKKNSYVLHSNGGYHLFAIRCSPNKNIKKIYRKKIWPWFESINKGKYARKDIARVGSITARDPYPKVTFQMQNGKAQTYYMHRVIALAFLYTEPVSKDRVNHINGKTVDYRVCNLEWITCSDNNRVKKPRGTRVWDKKYDIFKAKKFV